MGVPCSRCGRAYDVTLFQFGRTIHCTCGERVALEPRLRSARALAEPRFFAATEA
jgi:DNA-directed RNA polymerase subunit RPC12/RpoP